MFLCHKVLKFEGLGFFSTRICLLTPIHLLSMTYKNFTSVRGIPLLCIISLSCILFCITLGKSIFLVPHPDDETLGFGGTIRERVLAGDEVWIIVATHGEGSGVKRILSGQNYCSIHTTYHNPTTENYLDTEGNGPSLSVAEFGWARVREFYDSVTTLGVPTSHVQVYDYGDGLVSYIVATNLFASVVNQLGFWEKYYTVLGAQDYNYNVDHVNLAQALIDNQVIPSQNKKFYAVYEYRDSNHNNIQWFVDIGAYLATKRMALDKYKVWDPQNGRFMIGYHSVKDLFDAVYASPLEFMNFVPTGVSQWVLYK